MPRTLALITGASSGLGAEFARQLAAARCNLILTARREDKLTELARELTDTHGVTAAVLAADLSNPDGIAKVAEHIGQTGPDLLVNNAGFGQVAMLHGSDIARHLAMNHVHMTATLTLTHAALPAMVERRDGEIINVSSTAVWFPSPGGINYSATKAYINVFSEGLQKEVQHEGIRVQALCPGVTRTGFHSSEEWSDVDMSWVPEEQWMAADDVVEQSLARVATGEGVIFIPGERNRASAAATLKGPYWGPRP